MPDALKDILDQTLPPELQQVVKTLASAGQQPAAPAAPEPKAKQETTMPDLDQTQIANIASAAATKAATDLLAQKDAAQAVATKIAGLESERDTAKAEATRVNTDLATANKSIEKLTGEVAALGEKATKAEASVVELTKKLADADKTVASLKVEVAKANTEKAVAARVQVLTDKGFATQARIERFTAAKEDGTFKVADEDFNQAVADLVEAYEAGAAKKGDKKDEKKDDKAKDDEKKPPFLKGKANEGEEASAETTTDKAAASTAAPAAPDLTHVDQYAAATASLLGSGNAANPTATGRSKYASAFGTMD